MKKNRTYGLMDKIGLLKMIKMMRFTIFILFLSLSQTFAVNSYSQQTKLSLDMRNARVEDVLDRIEKNSEFFFMYNKGMVDVERKIDIQVEEKNVNEVLNKIFVNTDVSYSIKGRQILLINNYMAGTGNESIAQQQKSVSGKVTDSSGGPLPGVTVVVKGTSSGIITDANGNYSLEKVSGDATLVFSFVGMKTQEILIAGKSTVNVAMAEETIGIEEVVAVGYGTQKKANLTGSIASVSKEELTKRSSSNVENLLQGKTPGLEVYQTSGQAGADGASLRIRGMGTFSSAGSSPLVLIDGVEGSLSSLNPDDVESISVLKDAASAAIYGTRAANGVILVTTKMGSKGKFNIEYHGTVQLQQATMTPDLVTNSAEYMELAREAEPRGGTGYLNKYTDEIIEAYRNATDRNQYPNFDWIDHELNNAFAHTHHLSMNGDNNGTNYNFSLGYVNQDGIIDGIDFRKYNMNLKFQTEKKRYTVGGNIRLLYSDRNEPWYQAIMWSVYIQHPTFGPYLPDGSGKLTGAAYPWEIYSRSPEAINASGGIHHLKNGVDAQAFVTVNLMDGLKWHTKGAFSYNNSFRKDHQFEVPLYYYQSLEYASTQSPEQLGVKDQINTSLLPTFYSTLNYEKTINENHNVNLLVGYNQEYNKYYYLTGTRNKYPPGTEILDEINAGSSGGQTTSGSSSEWAIQSVFGRLNYNFKGKYLFESNVRYDGTSRIYKDTRWGFFPSFSGAWRISEEHFAKVIPNLDNLKLRASWGQLGNQNIGNYPYQSLLSFSPYSFENLQQGVKVKSLRDKNLKWETTTVTDLGIDLDIKNGLFSLTADWFNKVTSDILYTVEIPWSVGLNPPTTNYASIKNTGYEVVAGHRKTIGDFRYGVDFNFSTYKNEVTKVPRKSIGGRTIIDEGLPWNSFYLTEWIGIFQSQEDIDSSPVHQFNPKPGDLKFKDQNGDGKIDADDRVVVDGAFPKFNYGGNINLSWRNFDLSAFFYGEKGRKSYSWLWIIDPFIQGTAPTREFADNYWKPDRPTNKYPAMYMHYYAPIQGTASTYYLWNNSYLRLKNIQIGYNISDSFSKRIGLSKARVYLSADNLFTITKLRFGGDPEHANGFEQNYYPQLRVFTAGVKLTF